MSENYEEPLYLPRHCFVPLEIRENINITEKAKIFFGELNVLANKFGYCYASNIQLAEMKEVTIRTIQKWISNLSKEGYLKVEIKKVHIKTDRGVEVRTKRKIYIFENSKKVADMNKSSRRCDMNESSRINNKPIKIKKDPPHLLTEGSSSEEDFSSNKKLNTKDKVSKVLDKWKREGRDPKLIAEVLQAYEQQPAGGVKSITKWMEAVYEQKKNALFGDQVFEKRRNYARHLMQRSPNNYIFCEKNDYLSYISGALETKYNIKENLEIWDKACHL